MSRPSRKKGGTLRAAPRVSRVPPVRVSFVPRVQASKVVAVAPSKSGSRYRVAAPRRVDLAAGRARARDGPKVAKPKAQVLPEGDARSDASCVEALHDPLAFDTHAARRSALSAMRRLMRSRVRRLPP